MWRKVVHRVITVGNGASGARRRARWGPNPYEEPGFGPRRARGMHFIPNAAIKQELLQTIGAKDIGALFSDIPAQVRINGLKLPDGLSDMEAESYLRGLL